MTKNYGKLTVRENEDDLEIVYTDLEDGVKVPYHLEIGIITLPKLIKGIKNYLSSHKITNFKTDQDDVYFAGGGGYSDPKIKIRCTHKRKDGTNEKYVFFFPEDSTPNLLKGLEKIAKKKEGKNR